MACFLRGDTGENFKVRAYESLARRARHWADRIVCLSHTQAAGLPESLQAKVRIVVNAIEPWIGLERGQARLELAGLLGAELGTAPLVAMAGRLSPEKGASLFLQMAARLHAAVPQARFLVLGDGAMRSQLLAEAQGLGLDAWVHWAGHVADWTRWLAGVDLVVNPSWREQAPNVVLEAMAAGRPVLATRVGAVEEIGAGTIATVVPGDAVGLAAAAADVLRRPEYAADLGARARQRVQQQYSLLRQQEQLQALVAEFLPAALPASVPAWPSVSVVLPVRREAAHLSHVLEQLLRQDYPVAQLELLVADGGCDEADDGTTRLAQDYARRFPGRVC
ncbi:MAG: glycosyltransferase, partial [Terriglobales bacterium]